MTSPISVDDLRVKIFADGADLDSMLELAANPLIKGFTTNPTLMRKAGIKNLNPVGDSGYFYELALATRKDWPMLHEILNKAMDSISPAERRRIFRDWSTVPAN